MRVDVQVASAFFIGVNFLLALAIHLGTFYIFSAVRQLGSFYSALSLAPNVTGNSRTGATQATLNHSPTTFSFIPLFNLGVFRLTNNTRTTIV